MSLVINSSFDSPRISKKEILRYMGCRDSDEMTDALLENCLSESLDLFSYNVAHIILPLTLADNTVNIDGLRIYSKDLYKALSECCGVIIFAATVGLGVDRLIYRFSRISPSKAVCFDAIGGERVEALCDSFCEHMKERLAPDGLSLKPRFSPGYGDLSIELQRYIFSLLDCERRLGLTLNDSYLMSPTKSVTAIVGIYKNG